jgi:hypothetical protein
MQFYCYNFKSFTPLVYDLLDILGLSTVEELIDEEIPEGSFFITSFNEFKNNAAPIKRIFLKNPNKKIIVDCSQEGNPDIGEYDIILDYFTENLLLTDNIVFLTNNSIIDKFKTVEFRKYKFNILHYPGFFNSFNKAEYSNKKLIEKTNFIAGNPINSPDDDIIKYRTKKPQTDFLILNKSVKEFKLKFLEKIWSNNFFKKYKLRYTLVDLINIEFFKFNIDFRRELFGDLGDNTVKTLPNEYPISKNLKVGIDGVKVKWLFDSKVNIIVESIYKQPEQRFSDVVHISEKTWRCLAYGVPFVVVSTKNTLKYINDYGFKTFNVCIDENYDTLSDSERMQAVSDAAEELLSKWDDNKIEKICNFNRDLYKNKKHKRKWLETNFLNYLENWK